MSDDVTPQEFGQELGEAWKKTHKEGGLEQSDTERFNLCRGLGFFKHFVVLKSGEHKDRLDVKKKCIAPLS